ncbi:hypothetical protein Q9R34_19615 [Enterobacter sp. BRE11]|nr:hypothetical protein [Enterobacter sp. BRE11]
MSTLENFAHHLVTHFAVEAAVAKPVTNNGKKTFPGGFACNNFYIVFCKSHWRFFFAAHRRAPYADWDGAAKANPATPSEWFFLNYLRKLGGEGTFSQLISQSHSARICDYFLAYPAALPL